MLARASSLRGLLVLIAFSAAIAALRAEEPADENRLLDPEGWTSVFDGKSLDAFDVEGDVKVVDGAIVLDGREKSASLTLKNPPKSFDLRFEFANESGFLGAVVLRTKDGSSGGSQGLMGVVGEGELPKWNLYVCEIVCDPNSDGDSSSTEFSASGREEAFGRTYAFLAKSEREFSDAGPPVVAWRADQGQRLTLRNPSVRPREATPRSEAK